jgi:hypothetical protein
MPGKAPSFVAVARRGGSRTPEAAHTGVRFGHTSRELAQGDDGFVRQTP